MDLSNDSDSTCSYSDSDEDAVYEEVNQDSPVVDMEDNLTYHEDTLSIFKCTVDTPLGNDLQLWVTTDSGSMCCLMHSAMAKKLKLTAIPLSKGRRYQISGPGGGAEEVTHEVQLRVAVNMRHAPTNDTEIPIDEMGQNQIKYLDLSFGLIDALPVPILWGGKHMRAYDLLDLHRRKLLSFKLDNERWMTPSISWLQASAEMRECEDVRLASALRLFAPSRERLSNMVRGTRETINTYAKLVPGLNIVRVARHNAKIDEGCNEICLTNREEIEAEYGSMISIQDSISNDEAQIAVYNHTDILISLPAGRLKILIKPTVELPRLITPSSTDFKEKKSQFNPSKSTVPLSRLDRRNVPKSTFSWNCNGLKRMMEAGDVNDFYKLLLKLDPDVAGLQEVKLLSDASDPTLVKKGTLDEELFQSFIDPLKETYNVYLSLTLPEHTSSKDKRYAGQLLLVKKDLPVPKLSYNFRSNKQVYNNSNHYPHGRFIRADWGTDCSIMSVYAPFNGNGQEAHLERRRRWDGHLLMELSELNLDNTPRILMGDLNCCLKDLDLTHDPKFWMSRQGSTIPSDIADRGFGGTTANERMRMDVTLTHADMFDTSDIFPCQQPANFSVNFKKGIFKGKGMKLDYILSDSTILASGGVKSSYVVRGNGKEAHYMGSDHLPVSMVLDDQWLQKREFHVANNVVEKAKSIQDLIQETSTPEQQEELQGLDRPVPPELWSLLQRSQGELYYSIAEREMLRDIHKSNSYLPPSSSTRDKDNQLIQGSYHVKISTGEIESDGLRPVEFPESLWDYVDPVQKRFTKTRYDKFKDKVYLCECVDKVVNELDIQKSKARYGPSWWNLCDKPLEETLMRAQALANIDAFFFPDKDNPSLASDVEVEITTENNKPARCRPRRLSAIQQAFLQAKTNQMIRDGKLEPSTSDWCHGLVLVAYEERIKAFMDRQGDTAMEDMFLAAHEKEVATFFRLCIDLRQLNEKLIMDIFPLPRIDDLLESIPRNCGRYSIGDICDAFFVCKVAEKDRFKTAFKIHDRHLQFAVMPQGLASAPSVFSRLIARTFEGMSRHQFSAYIDDVLNHTDDFQEHINTQQELYNRLRKSNLTMKISKCHLNYSQVKFLGHILTKEGRHVDPKAIEAIDEWKDPTTAKEVRSFLGATLYYREYIYQYSDMAMPLYELIRKGVNVAKEWDPDKHGVACQRIKDALTSKPVLMNIDNTKKFRLKIDACRVGRGLGCILEQPNDEGKWQPVSYYSQSLNQAERNYSATELECKALRDCILHYKLYLQYTQKFEVLSDHNALSYMLRSDNSTTNGRLMRYLLDLQGFNFALHYRSGHENQDADAVSRLLRKSDQPVYLTADELRDDAGIVTPRALGKAIKLSSRNLKLEEEARKALREMDKLELREASTLNDHILSEGVENLETESGRLRFLKNIKKKGLSTTEASLGRALADMQPRKKTEELLENEYVTVDTESLQESTPMVINDPLVNLAACFKEQLPQFIDTEEEDFEGFEKVVNLVKNVMEPTVDTPVDDSAYDSSMSSDVLPTLLAHMTKKVLLDIKYRGEVRQNKTLNVNAILELREKIKDRVTRKTKRAKLTSNKRFTLLAGMQDPVYRANQVHSECCKKFTLCSVNNRPKRKVARVDYNDEYKIYPNVNQLSQEEQEKIEYSPINDVLQRGRKLGRDKCEVRTSLLKDAGWGLFANKKISEAKEVCSYEGVEVTADQLHSDYADRDYVAEAVVDHVEKTRIYIDSINEASCYGRFANDCIDDHLINAKILWIHERKGHPGGLRLVATRDIAAGEEIYVSYSLEYWRSRLNRLPETLKERLEPLCGRSKVVQFTDQASVATFQDTKRAKSIIRQAQGVPLQSTPCNYQTRVHHLNIEEMEEQDPVESERETNEEFLHENVEECEELADKVRKQLVGRLLMDEGKEYRISAIQFDENSGLVIGFRGATNGVHRREDEDPYAVFGSEGLYELAERYSVDNPDPTSGIVWPKNNVEWAMRQATSKRWGPLLKEMLDKDCTEMITKVGKFRLVPTDEPEITMLVRVLYGRQGEVEQSVVPEDLIKLSMQYHHEGFAHLGTNRMLETLKLRYYWEGMEKDVREHVKSCASCKLRKAYQRRPRVPIMKYDATKRVLDRVHVDLTGPLPKTAVNGCRYIMVIKDFLTKYVWLIPLATKSAAEVAENFVTKFICQAGVPGMIVSDKGNEFVNQLLENVSKILGINKVSTTPYNPRSDGFVENHNKTLKDQLHTMISTLTQDDWDI